MKNERESVRVWAMVAAAVVSVVCVVGMSACNTVSGVGKDIQEASDNVKHAIEN
ncbi:MAG: entericidin A/B family lipoprotein [Phycisphaerales bacterium]